MNIFISQLMKNRELRDILRERQDITRWVCSMYCTQDNGVNIIDSFVYNKCPTSVCNEAVWHLGESISKLATADIIVMGPNWEDGRGTCIEHRIAEDYGIKVLYYGDSQY